MTLSILPNLSFSKLGCSSSKAALNHLASTLSVEEPDVTSIALRPGVVDTDMQVLLRSNGSLYSIHDVYLFHPSS